MNVLFICNQNKHRSKTAEHLFKDQFTTKSAGLHNDRPVTEVELLWADLVLVMEEHQRSTLAQRFPSVYLKKQILVLNIPDVYAFNQPELISLLRQRMTSLVEPLLELH